MSSKLQLGLDVCHNNQWWRRLVNAYEVEAGMVLFADKTEWSKLIAFGVSYEYDKGAIQIHVN